jgi:hypothetical protein
VAVRAEAGVAGTEVVLRNVLLGLIQWVNFFIFPQINDAY